MLLKNVHQTLVLQRIRTLFVEKRNQTYLLFVVNTIYGFLVVLKYNVIPLDTLGGVFFLFKLKHMLIEVLLQSFIGEVDAKLFETIFLEDLKAKDIQNVDR